MSNKTIREYTRDELITCLRFSMENSTKFVKLPICIWGWHGIGKTELVKQVAKEMDYNLIVLHLSTQDMIDLIGRPITEKVDDIEVQKWATPNWLSEALRNRSKTGRPNLFLLDEMNRAHQLVLNAMLPFLIEGSLHEHRIGDTDVVVAACNPSDGENYEVNDMTDKALLDRMGHITLSPTNSEYVQYLQEIGMDPVTISVIETNPNFINIPKIDPGFSVEPSRRSIVNVMKNIGQMDDKWIKTNGSTVIECFLGEEFKDKWLASWHSTEGVVDLRTMMNCDQNKEKIASLMFGEIDGNKVVRNDILDNSVEIIKNHLIEKRVIGLRDIKWIVNFLSMEGMPQDYLAALISTNNVILKSVLEDEKVNEYVGDIARQLSIISQPPFPMGVFK